MSTITKNKLLGGAVIILLLTNIAMLVFFFCCKGGGGKGPRGGGREAMMKEFLQKEIGFSPQQLQQYDTLSKQHRQKMKTAFDEMKGQKEQQFKELGANGFSDSAIQLSAEKSSARQKEMETGMLRHFKEIRALCTQEQQPKFDSLFYKVWNRKKR